MGAQRRGSYDYRPGALDGSVTTWFAWRTHHASLTPYDGYCDNERRLIIYATRAGGAEQLMTTTLDGKIKARLQGQAGDIREPDWGPFQK